MKKVTVLLILSLAICLAACGKKVSTPDEMLDVVKEKENISAFYKAIDTHYPVLCCSDFWMHITGDENFYQRLAKAFGEVVDEDGIDGSTLILAKVEEIAEEIRLKGGL